MIVNVTGLHFKVTYTRHVFLVRNCESASIFIIPYVQLTAIGCNFEFCSNSKTQPNIIKCMYKTLNSQLHTKIIFHLPLLLESCAGSLIPSHDLADFDCRSFTPEEDCTAEAVLAECTFLALERVLSTLLLAEIIYVQVML